MNPPSRREASDGRAAVQHPDRCQLCPSIGGKPSAVAPPNPKHYEQQVRAVLTPILEAQAGQDLTASLKYRARKRWWRRTRAATAIQWKGGRGADGGAESRGGAPLAPFRLKRLCRGRRRSATRHLLEMAAPGDSESAFARIMPMDDVENPSAASVRISSYRRPPARKSSPLPQSTRGMARAVAGRTRSRQERRRETRRRSGYGSRTITRRSSRPSRRARSRR